MQQKITVITLPITKKGELNFFQISLPRDIDRIVGMQAGIMGVENLFEVTERYVAGIVKVQAENVADCCYSSEVAIGRSDFEVQTIGSIASYQPLTDMYLLRDVDSQLKPLLIRNSFTLYGCYEDFLIKKLNAAITYTIRLYVWTETDEPDKKAKP